MSINKKFFLAMILEKIKINDISLHNLNKKYQNNYIRIINYHEITADKNFEEHLGWFKQNFQNCTYEMLEDFLSGHYIFTEKPGLIITFDDGFDNNYTIAKPFLEQYGFTGWFFVSTSLINTYGYMTTDNLQQLVECNHVIGGHTWSHHRMSINDTDDILKHEIVYSKQILETILRKEVTIFCWVGGEDKTYTARAERYIESGGYCYSMMTLSLPITPQTSPYYLQRTNIQEYWPLSVVKMQLCGLIDLIYCRKRKKIIKRIKSEQIRYDGREL